MHRGERRASYARGEAEYWGLLLKEVSPVCQVLSGSFGAARLEAGNKRELPQVSVPCSFMLAGRWAADGLDRMPGRWHGGARVGTGGAADLGRRQF